MAQPNLSAVHVNAPLTQMSVAYVQSENKFVANRVFPNVNVAKQSDLYYIFDKADFLRDELGKKAPGAGPETGGYGLEKSDPYFAHVYAYGHKIPDQIRANADSPLNLDVAAMRFATAKVLIQRERLFATTYMSTSVWGKDITGVVDNPTGDQVLQWNDAQSTPIEDIRAGMTYVEGTTGFRPNTLTLSRGVWDVLADHPDIVDRVKYSGGVGNGTPARVTQEAVAQILELDNVYVSGAVVNTAEKGAAAAVGYIMGKSALLTYTPAAPTIMEPAAGLTFSWSGFLGSQNGFRIRKYRLPEAEESDQVEAQTAYAQHMVGADLGYFFTSIVA